MALFSLEKRTLLQAITAFKYAKGQSREEKNGLSSVWGHEGPELWRQGEMLLRRDSGDGLPGRCHTLHGGLKQQVMQISIRDNVSLPDPASQQKDGLHHLLRFLVTLFHLGFYIAEPPRAICPNAQTFPLSAQGWCINSSHQPIAWFGMCSCKC